MRHFHSRPFDFKNRRYIIGTATAILIGAGVVAAAAGASTAVAAKSAADEKKNQRNAVNDANKKQKDLENAAAGANASAAAAAKEKVDAKKRAVTPTILTSPLGVNENEDGAGIQRPSLLGGGQ